MTEEEPSAKRMKSTDANDDSNQPLNSDEDLSKSNAKLPNFICEKWYLDAKTADVRFKFEKDDGEIVEVHAHKLVLTTGSNVFRTMFYGSIPEGDEVKITDVTAAAFQEFLAFFYMENVTLTLENIEEVIYSIKKYGIERCLKNCVEFLIEKLENDNVCFGYRLAIKYGLDDLKYFCERMISANAKNVVETECFFNSEWEVFNEIMKQDSLVCEETQVFDVAMKWAEKSCEKKDLATDDMQNLRDQLKGSLYLIHFQRMKLEDFSPRHTKYSGLFTVPDLTDIIQMFASMEFKSQLFTSNPISTEIFAWDEDHILECSFSEKLLELCTESANQPSFSYSFSSNKCFLFGQIHLASLVCGGVRVQLIKGSNDVFNDYFKYDASNENFINGSLLKFTKPILIHHNCVYQIKITFPSSYNSYYYYRNMNSHKKIFNDIEIEFGVGNPTFPFIIDAIYLNRL